MSQWVGCDHGTSCPQQLGICRKKEVNMAHFARSTYAAQTDGSWVMKHNIYQSSIKCNVRKCYQGIWREKIFTKRKMNFSVQDDYTRIRYNDANMTTPRSTLVLPLENRQEFADVEQQAKIQIKQDNVPPGLNKLLGRYMTWWKCKFIRVRSHERLRRRKCNIDWLTDKWTDYPFKILASALIV